MHLIFMGRNQEYGPYPIIVLTNPPICKLGMMLFFVFLTFSIIELSHQNPVEAQTTMYKCTPDMGINVSMVNCLTNSTSDTYNHSMISEMRQNATK
jgi:hypothetical protein